MSNLPLTTLQDLAAMDITAEMVANALRAAGRTWDGEVVGLYLPTPAEGEGIVSATNYLVSDWVIDSVSAPTVKSQSSTNQEIYNFDGTSDIDTTATSRFSETVATDYTLTQPFNVSLNDDILLGGSDTLTGFTAGMDSTDVEKKSVSSTAEHAANFDVQVPAGEGRLITDTVTEFSYETVYRASIGVQGAVGVLIKSTLDDFKDIVFFNAIEKVFPSTTASSYITRTDVSTYVDRTLTKVTRTPEGSSEKGVLESYTIYAGPVPETFLAREQLTDSLDIDDGNSEEDYDIMAFNKTLRFRVTFTGPPFIPAQHRFSRMLLFRKEIYSSVNPTNAIPRVRPRIVMVPNRRSAQYGAIALPYDDAVIARDDLEINIVHALLMVNWGGERKLTWR